MSDINPNLIHKSLSIAERKGLKKIMEGKVSPDSIKGRNLLDRPHVAIAFEVLLDKYALSDDKLLKRLAVIVKRKATESISEKGIKSTNITSIDANARDTIRLIWQIQGRFVDKHELGGPGDFKKMEDKELDKFIDTGLQFLLNRGKVPLTHDLSEHGDPNITN